MARAKTDTSEVEKVPYRKVEVGTWWDDKFRALSRPQPNGQTLWLYLLTGQRTTPLPGLVVARQAVMADDLGWDLDGFRYAFGEAIREGMVDADWDAGVVVLRKALFDSSGRPRDTTRPVSVNQFKGWAKHLRYVPECALKAKYLDQLKALAHALGDAFRYAFADAFADACRKASVIQRTENSEQRTEKEKNSAPPSVGGSLFDASLPAQPVLDKIQEHLGDVGVQRALGSKKRKPKPSEPTDSELASVRIVLDKLSAQNGVRYSGTSEHTRLIVSQLRAGRSEMDLRAVIGYCALELEWKFKPEMAKYLRPETLFGPQTISKYLDPALTWFENNGGHEKHPREQIRRLERLDLPAPEFSGGAQ